MIFFLCGICHSSGFSSVIKYLKGGAEQKLFQTLKTLYIRALKFLIDFDFSAAFCSPVPVPTNGAVQGFRYELGATLRITCKHGYNLVPSSSSFRTCISNGVGGGKWTGQDPLCECKYLEYTLIKKIFSRKGINP